MNIRPALCCIDHTTTAAGMGACLRDSTFDGNIHLSRWHCRHTHPCPPPLGAGSARAGRILLERAGAGERYSGRSRHSLPHLVGCAPLAHAPSCLSRGAHWRRTLPTVCITHMSRYVRSGCKCSQWRRLSARVEAFLSTTARCWP